MRTKNRNMKLDIEIIGDVMKIAPRRNINMQTAPLLRKQLMRLMKKKPGRVVVNLGMIEEIDTSGLATLVEFTRRLKQNGGEMTLNGIREGAADELSLQQVKNILNFCSD